METKAQRGPFLETVGPGLKAMIITVKVKLLTCESVNVLSRYSHTVIGGEAPGKRIEAANVPAHRVVRSVLTRDAGAIYV